MPVARSCAGFSSGMSPPDVIATPWIVASVHAIDKSFR
jgi:hypothetical protein